MQRKQRCGLEYSSGLLYDFPIHRVPARISSCERFLASGAKSLERLTDRRRLQAHGVEAVEVMDFSYHRK